MKRYLMCLITVSMLFNCLAFGYTQKDLDAVTEKWRSYPPFVNTKAVPKASDLALAAALADRLLTFTHYQVSFELDMQAAQGDKDAIAAIEESNYVPYSWQELYRLHQSLRISLAACTTVECVDHLVNAQKRFFNFAERIGVKSNIVDMIGDAGNTVTHAIAEFFGFGKKPKDILTLSLVTAIFDEAQKRVTNSRFPKYFMMKSNDLPEDGLRTVQALMLHQLARLALSEDNVPEFTRAPRNNGFTPEWRYSENVWLEAIRHAKIAHLEGKADDFIVPMRREYGGLHRLTCHNASTGNNPTVGHVAVGIGISVLQCTSEQGGSYNFSAASAGADVSLTLGVGGTLFLRSAIPHLHYFTPEGHAVGLDLGIVPFVGGRIRIGLKPNLIRIYSAEVEFGQSFTLAGEGINIVQTVGAHNI